MGGYRGVATQHVLAPNQKIISPPPSFNVGTLVVATPEVMISRMLGFIGKKNSYEKLAPRLLFANLGRGARNWGGALKNSWLPIALNLIILARFSCVLLGSKQGFF